VSASTWVVPVPEGWERVEEHCSSQNPPARGFVLDI
jgi:hypothetical protein